MVFLGRTKSASGRLTYHLGILHVGAAARTDGTPLAEGVAAAHADYPKCRPLDAAIRAANFHFLAARIAADPHILQLSRNVQHYEGV